MIKVFAESVAVGSFVRVADPFAQPHYRLRWWKVLAIEGRVFHLVNRDGSVGRWHCSTNAASRFYLWQPGDPRHDDR